MVEEEGAEAVGFGGHVKVNCVRAGVVCVRDCVCEGFRVEDNGVILSLFALTVTLPPTVTGTGMFS